MNGSPRQTRAPAPTVMDGPAVAAPTQVLTAKPTLAAAIALALLAVLQWVPGLDGYRPLSPREASPDGDPDRAALAPDSDTVGEAKLTKESGSRPELAQPEHATLPTAARGPIARHEDEGFVLPDVQAKEPPVPVEDPSGHALTGFYEALGRTRRKLDKAITRIAHYGDSIVVSDYVSGTLRRRMQDQFGDAGHGFLLMAGAWPAYHHNDVFRWASGGWTLSRIVGPLAADGYYGLGGVTFSAPPGARARFGTAKKGSYGRRVARFELVYLEQPGNCRFELMVDGKHHSEIEASGPSKQLRHRVIDVASGEHEFEVVVRAGTCRAFGAILEDQSPGVVLDAIGVQGARIRFLDKQDDAHWAEQLRLRRPDLMIFQFGANESADGFAYPMAEYHQTMLAVLQQSKRALPNAGCLVVGAMDRAHKKDDILVSLPIMPHLVREQRAAALEAGCAFFDTRQAMGGEGSMAKWVRAGMGQADYTHPSGYGAEILGNWLYRALIQGYNAHKGPERDAPAAP